VDFGALDSEPVSLVLMLVGPESAAGLHVKVLGQISRVLHEQTVRKQLVAADSPGEFLAAIREAESR
jgi:mannitol/fructose-specific phosphotransferase system IIA component (Ntr-type)